VALTRFGWAACPARRGAPGG